MSWAGRWWRGLSIVLPLALFYRTVLSYLVDDALLMAVSGFGGVVVFFVFWSLGDWFDLNEKCCTKTRPHTRQDYGEGQHWMTEEMR